MLNSNPASTSTPAVSVVIPCYNYAHYLPDALQSVLTQTFQNFEIIIVNDGSADNTVAVAQRLISAHPNYSIKLINQQNSGHPACSRNAGIAKSRGTYILPLDADDKLHPLFLEKMVQTLADYPLISIVYCDTIQFDGLDGAFSNPDWNPETLRFSNFLNYCSLYPKSLWEQLGGYKPCGFEDWEFWLNAVEHGYQGIRVPMCLFYYRTKKGGRLEEKLLPKDAEYKAQLVILHPSLYEQKELDWAWSVIRSLKS